jgi:hypothetical protein
MQPRAMNTAEQHAADLGYVQSPDGYWYHRSWKGQPGWQDRPWLDTAEEVVEYEAIYNRKEQHR